MSDRAGAPAVVPYEVYRARRATEARMEAVELEMDETVPGGRYLVGDQVVNANGEPIKETKETKAPAKGDDK